MIATQFQSYLKKEKIAEYIYFKHDGSIEGFEIVTHPMTSQFIHKKLRLKPMLSWLKVHKCKSYDSEHCGLHIHANKKFFREIDIVKLRLFFKTNWEPIIKFAQRNGKGMNFCQPDPSTIKDIINCKTPHGRYWGININTGSKGTVEFRVFRGTLRHERLLASLQFVDAICHFVKAVGITSLIEGKEKKKSWEPFLKWIKESNRYDHLVRLIKKGKLR